MNATVQVLWTRGDVVLFVVREGKETEYHFGPEMAIALGLQLIEKGRLAGPPPLFSAPLRLVDPPKKEARKRRAPPAAADSSE
jgi:hypothetical protein